MSNEQLSCGANIHLDPDECDLVKNWLRTQIGDGIGDWARALIEHIEDAQREWMERHE